MTAVTEKKIVQLQAWIKARDGRKTPPDAVRATRIIDTHTLEFVKAYSEAERTSANGESLAGEIYWLYFRADKNTQETFIEALCKSQHIDVPLVSLTPRQQLTWAVYGANPEAMGPSGDKDTIGGKRITGAIARYEEVSGLRKKAVPLAADAPFPRHSRTFLAGLYAKARPNEKKILDRLITRVYGRPSLETLAA